MKNLIIWTLVVCAVQSLSAQQLTPYTIYREQWGVVNPASISNNYTIREFPFSIAASHRQQYLGLDDPSLAPNTQVLNFEWMWENYNSLVGGHLLRDQTGLLSRVGLYGRYAYQIKIGWNTPHIISVGLSAGIVRFQSNIESTDFRIEELAITPGSDYYADVNVGIYYQYEDWFYAGLSIPQTFAPGTSIGDATQNFNLKQVRHYYGVAGFYIPFDFFGLGDESSFLEPSVWLKYVPKETTHFDLNVRYVANQIFWVGLGGSSAGLGHFEAGLLAGEALGLANSQFKIGISYDQAMFTKLNQLGGSFEVNVSYSWY